MSDQQQQPNINTFEYMFDLYRKSQRTMIVILLAVIVGLIAYVIYQENRYDKAIEKLTATVEQKKAVEKELSDAQVILKPIEKRINGGASYIHKKHNVPMDVAYQYSRSEMIESLNSGMAFITGLAVSGKESEFRPRAVSYTGCCYGIKQIHLGVWKKEKPGLTLKDLYDPDRNIKLGYQILREYYDKTGSIGLALQRYYGSTVQEENIAYADDVLRRSRYIAKYVNG